MSGSLFHLRRLKPPAPKSPTKKKGKGKGKQSSQDEEGPPSFVNAVKDFWQMRDEEVLPKNKIVEVTSFFMDSSHFFTQHQGRKRRQLMDRVQFFCPNNESPFSRSEEYVSNPHCEMWYENGHYWIKDLQSAKGTFVNGRNIATLGKQRMKDDDVISFGISHRDPIFYTNRKLDLVYKFILEDEDEEDLTSTATSEEEDPKMLALMQQIFGNDLILSEIITHLPFADVKTARLVNSDWNKAANKTFYSGGAIRMKSEFAPEFAFFFRHYDSYFRKSAFENAIVNLGTFDSCNECCDSSNKSFISDAKWFVDTFGSKFKYIKLNIDTLHTDMSSSILSKLKNVEEMQLTLSTPLSGDSSVLQIPDVSLPLVKSLTLRIMESDEDADLDDNFEEKYKSIFVQLMARFPNLQCLSVKSNFEFASNKYAIATLQEKKELLKGIKKFSIKFDDMDRVDVLVNLTTLRFPATLSRLELDNINKWMTTENTTLVLEHYSQSLEHLGLSVSESCSHQNHMMGDQAEAEDTSVNKNLIVFGKFPKLKSLRITMASATDERVWFKFDYDSRQSRKLKYSEIFPVLTTLKFVRSSFDESRFPMTLVPNGYMAPFLKGADVCQTVKRLQLPYTNQKGKNPVYRAFITTLAQTFPKVDTELFRKVRNDLELEDNLSPTFNPEEFARKSNKSKKPFHLCILNAIGLNGCVVCNPRKKIAAKTTTTK